MTFRSRFAVGPIALITSSLIIGCSGGAETSAVPTTGFAASMANPLASNTLSSSQVSATTPVSAALGSSAVATRLSTDASASASFLTERPGQADAFVDSAGADSRFTPGMAESVNFAASSAALYASGIRHLRDGTSTAYERMEEIGAHGIKHSIGFGSVAGYGSSLLTTEVIDKALATEAKNVDFVEASNEYDNSGDPRWATALRYAQALLYKTIRANRAWNDIAVLAPALENPKNAAILGEVQADGGNLHNATCSFNPATTERSVDTLRQQAELRAESGSAPVWTTEAGYDNDTRSSCYISEDGAAKYIPRTLAYRWNAGMPRTYFDSWSDENAASFAHMGFVTQNGVPKKQYYALQSLLKLLADPGAAFTPSPLQFRISGSTANVMHTLLQKRNGEYALLLWLEVPSWDQSRRTPIAVRSQPIQVTLAKNAADVTLYEYVSNWGLHWDRVQTTLHSINFNVTDSVSILTFKT